MAVKESFVLNIESLSIKFIVERKKNSKGIFYFVAPETVCVVCSAGIPVEQIRAFFMARPTEVLDRRNYFLLLEQKKKYEAEQQKNASAIRTHEVGSRRIEYRVERSANRKKISWKCTPSGLVLAVPSTFSEGALQEFIRKEGATVFGIVTRHLEEEKAKGGGPWTQCVLKGSARIFGDKVVFPSGEAALFIEKTDIKAFRLTFSHGKFIARYPLKESEEALRSWLEQQIGWMEKQFSDYAPADCDEISQMRRRLLEQGEISLLGRSYRIVMVSGSDRAAQQSSCELFVRWPGDQEGLPTFPIPEEDQKTFLSALREVVILFADTALRKVLLEVAAEKGLQNRVGSVSVMRSVRIWGRCTAAKKIELNWSSVFVSEEMLRYLCCHELAHLTHMNHSRSFWALVGHYMPDYKTPCNELRKASPKNFARLLAPEVQL